MIAVCVCVGGGGGIVSFCICGMVKRNIFSPIATIVIEPVGDLYSQCGLNKNELHPLFIGNRATIYEVVKKTNE